MPLQSSSPILEKPNEQQRKPCEHFVHRLKVQYLAKQRGTVNQSKREPLPHVVHEFLGTGKSAVISWMRQLMEEALGWEHDVQLVCFAFHNAVAAQKNGHSVHHWNSSHARRNDGNAFGGRYQHAR